MIVSEYLISKISISRRIGEEPAQYTEDNK